MITLKHECTNPGIHAHCDCGWQSEPQDDRLKAYSRLAVHVSAESHEFDMSALPRKMPPLWVTCLNARMDTKTGLTVWSDGLTVNGSYPRLYWVDTVGAFIDTGITHFSALPRPRAQPSARPAHLQTNSPHYPPTPSLRRTNNVRLRIFRQSA